VALLGLVGAGVLVGVEVRRRLGLGWAVVAGLALFAQPALAHWAGLHRVDSLALSLTLAGIVLTGSGRLVLAALLCVMAALTKQTYLAAPLAVVIWLAVERRWRDAFLFAGTVAVVLGATTMLLEWTTNGAFFDHVVNANINPFSLGLVGEWSIFGAITAGPLFLLAVVGAAMLPRNWLLWKLYFGLSFVNVVALGKDGASFNYWFEPLAAAAVLGTGALALIAGRVPAAAIVTGAATALLAFSPILPATIETVGSARNYRAERASVAWAVEQVRRAPGAVLSEDIGITALAGQSTAFEYVIFSMLWLDGHWRDDQLLNDVATGRYQRLILLGSDDPLSRDCRCMPPTVWSALQRHFALRATDGRFTVYDYHGSDEPAPNGYTSEGGSRQSNPTDP
jgi:hypothetical protein